MQFSLSWFHRRSSNLSIYSEHTQFALKLVLFLKVAYYIYSFRMKTIGFFRSKHF